MLEDAEFLLETAVLLEPDNLQLRLDFIDALRRKQKFEKAFEQAEALVTWHLETANGAEYSKDLKHRLWPTKGGWSGPLRTASIRIALQGEKEE